ncbi:hypothetical protein BN137_4146 [Cronobacter condimenti 1330]|uniref:Uncharacterized protein n=1 Tax=Cronobacter condimenti 1330 TaxID=1073999 RepID=K8A409_9ENTR|nr:STY0301 family protein [Cronobacter condimenti]ALB63790.1 hypothetical protein AFK62_15360 [Cronobacter condimenti 1330]CCJ74746.1 hypothetical protein BN137_4146 [Cronobacter condimenti 1330]
MSWNKPLLLYTALLSLSAIVSAEKITCPNVLQDAALSHRLNDVSLFQGPPEKQGELMPDNDKHIVWTLKTYQDYGKKMHLPLWLVCRYDNTVRTVNLVVPETASQCMARFGDSKNIFHAGCE